MSTNCLEEDQSPQQMQNQTHSVLSADKTCFFGILCMLTNNVLFEIVQI